jgi:signal transduction histidine kinase
MTLLQQWFQGHLDIVYFVYGLAFIVMGQAIAFQTNKASGLKIAKIFWLLSAFGLFHGSHEWLDMWELIKGTDLAVLQLVTRVISFILLFEFGRRLLLIVNQIHRSPAVRFTIIQIFSGNLIWVLFAIIFVVSFASSNFFSTYAILTRYLLALPGGLMTGYALFLYYQYEHDKLPNLKIYFVLAGTAFMIYGVLGGLVVQKGTFYPSTVLNEDAFMLATLFPVQLFRAVCALVIAASMSVILRVFDLERTKEKQNLFLELASSNSKLREMDKLKTESILIVSHELKTPLTSIMGFAHTLANLSVPAEKAKHYLEIIEAESKRLDMLINEYLDISMIEAGTLPMPKNSSNIQSIIKETIESYKLSKNISIELNFPEELSLVMANKDKIKQVIINLLDNAAKYSPENGKITITGKNMSDHLVFCIVDEGFGIKNEDLNKLYDKFYRSTEGGSRGIKGLGLGLAITKGIVEAHKGKIWVESEAGKGSTFCFTISKL